MDEEGLTDYVTAEGVFTELRCEGVLRLAALPAYHSYPHTS